MNKKKQQVLAEVLEAELAASEQMWKEGKPHAYIVGYLQGLIKTTIKELKDQDYKVNIFIFNQLKKHNNMTELEKIKSEIAQLVNRIDEMETKSNEDVFIFNKEQLLKYTMSILEQNIGGIKDTVRGIDFDGDSNC